MKRQQRSWAKARRIAIDESGYRLTLNDNLFMPLPEASRSEFAAGEGSEFGTPDGRKKKGIDLFIVTGKWELIRQSLQREQLTGSPRFVDEIEKKIERRVECQGRERPKKTEK